MKYLLLFVLLSTYLFSAPAFNKTREFRQADGTSFVAKAKGDSYLNWIETMDGEILKYNSKSKNFEHAKINNSRLEASGEKYEKKSSTRTSSSKRVNRLNIDDVYKLWQVKRRGGSYVK